MRKKILFLFLFISLSVITNAQVDQYSSPTVNVAINAVTFVDDFKLRDAESLNNIDQTNMHITNLVKIGMKEDFYYPQDFDATVTVEIYSTLDNSDPLASGNYITKTLSLSYKKDKGAIYKHEDSYELDELAHSITVKVVGISSPQLGSNVPANCMELHVIKIADRGFNFTDEEDINFNFSQNQTNSTQVNISWNALLGAQEYDLEWAIIDPGSEFETQAATNLSSGADDGLENIFKNNATRVTLTDQLNYLINLVYRSKYLVTRVRGVKYVNGLRQFGKWNYHKNGGGVGIIDISGLNYAPFKPQLNWSYEASYAEEGKKKEVISYFDGTLRNRQKVTINNEVNVPIIQENVYDEFGRPILDILPAPYKEVGTTNDPLRLYKHLNQSSDLSKDYNFENINQVAGKLIPEPINTAAGASKYYSEANDFKNPTDPKSLLVPDAEGYPFAIKQYMADATGRIKMQGGVGPTFQPMETGLNKTTRYFYGKPEQWELDQVFGNDVGYARHYLKNVVIDPNGQASISYLNLAGKTIATALAGDNPENLNPLTNKTEKKVIESELINYADFIYDAKSQSLKATAPFNATTISNTNQLIVNIPKLIYTYNHSASGNVFDVCSNCYYNLKVVVKDELNESVISATSMSDYQIGNTEANCDDIGVFNQPIDLKDFVPGTYYISVELSLNKNIIESFAAQYIDQLITHGVLKTKSNHILDELNTAINKELVLSDVNSCETCTQLQNGQFQNEMKSRLIYISDGLIQENDPKLNQWLIDVEAALTAKCAIIQANCNTDPAESPCDQYKDIMLIDVSPGGQYALFDENFQTLEPELNVIASHFRAVFPVLPATDPLYVNATLTLENGDFISPYDAAFTVADVVKYWQDDWAIKFLPFHPEYCKLEFCMLNSGLYELESEIKNKHSLRNQIATIPYSGGTLAYRYDQPEWLINADAAFDSNGLLYPKRAEFIADLTNYSDYLRRTNNKPVDANFNDKSVTQVIDFLTYCNTYDVNPTAALWNNCSIPTTDNCRLLNKEWQTYTQIYFELRNKYVEELRDAFCVGKYPFTCKIGEAINLPIVPPNNYKGDFILEADNDYIEHCGADYTMMRLKRISGNINKVANVMLSYPDNFTGVLPSYNFKANETERVFCLPKSFDSSLISIFKVRDQIFPECSSNAYLNFNDGNENNLCEDIFYVYEPTFGRVRYQIFPAGTHTQVEFQGDVQYPAYTNLKNFGTFNDSRQDDVEKQYSYPVDLFKWYINEDDESLDITANTSEYYGNNIVLDKQISQVAAGEYEIQVGYANNEYNNHRDLAGRVDVRYKFKTSANAVNYSTARYYYGKLNSGTNTNSITFNVNGYDVQIVECEYANSHDILRTDLPPNTTCPLSLARKKSRFDFAGDVELSSDEDDYRYAGEDQIIADGQSNCELNAETWVRTYYPEYPDITGQDLVDADLMKAQFIAICKRSVNIDRPNGTSSLYPGSGITPNSFGEVIKGGLPKYTAERNPYLLEQLYPYETTLHITPSPISIIDEDMEDRLDYFAVLADNTTVYNYLKAHFGKEMTLTLDEVNELYRAKNCPRKELDMAIILPAFFKEGGFVNHQQYLDAKDEMQAEFSTVLTEDMPNYESILAGFMNQKFGFGMAYYQYDEYETKSAIDNNLLLYHIQAKPNIDYYAGINTVLLNKYLTIENIYDRDIINKKAAFRLNYINTCVHVKPAVKMRTQQSFYHYTLYYYDQAGNLLKTVPPQGVKILTQVQTAQAALYRELGEPVTDCVINGFSTDKVATFNTLQQTLTGTTPAAIEMWWYKENPINSHTIFTAGSGSDKFMINTCLLNQKLAVEIYKINEQNGAASILFSNKVYVSLQGIDLRPWNHVVIQGNQLKASAFDVFVNGTKATPLTEPFPIDCGWQIGNGTALTYPEDLTELKHLRLYNRSMSQDEINLNAKDLCFMPSQPALAWLRWNIPTQPGPITLAGTTQEIRSQSVYPNHVLATHYAYNSLNQVTAQTTPDAGRSNFYYDKLGRLFASQNAQQNIPDDYSYTYYDSEGRIVEVGKKHNGDNPQGINGSSFNFDNEEFLISGNNTEITRTFYDDISKVNPDGSNLTVTTPLISNIENTRKRVVASIYTEDEGAYNGTFYSYDIGGNVKTLWQQLDGLPEKRIDYDYDLISGKVNMVAFQHQSPDRFYYQYEYDAENKLTKAWSGINAVFKPNGGHSYLIDGKLDASYQYYLHGPLARMELSSPIVQGIDYAYTLQGWLKGVNSSNLAVATDIGKDGEGTTGNLHKDIPKDIYGYALHYFGTNDFKTVGGTSQQPFAQAEAAGSGFTPLFNGNIAAMSVNNRQFNDPLLYTYKYDQLNRLNNTYTYSGLAINTNTWAGTATQKYRETFNYDANGNILSLKRNNESNADVSDLNYYYNRDGNGDLLNNKLSYVNAPTGTTDYPADLANQNAGNFEYDEIGNLTDDAASQNHIEWNVYGKIAFIERRNGDHDIYYQYDASGNRVNKLLGNKNTWYIRDAQGNPIAIYSRDGSNAIKLDEYNLYGSSRLGSWKANATATDQSAFKLAWQSTQGKDFELTNHLGNVMAVISGNYYVNSSGEREAIVNSANDYYAFGAPMPGRTYTAAGSSSYRYGFNGKENDNDVKGEGNQQDYGMRIYDPRLGRFLSVDPLTKKFPAESPYIYAGDNPVGLIDVEGGKKTYYITLIMDGKSTTIKLVTKYEVNTVVVRQRESINVMGQTLLTTPEISNTYTYDMKQDITIDAKSGKIITGKIEKDGLRSNSATIRDLQDDLEEFNANLKDKLGIIDSKFSGGIIFVSQNGGSEEKRTAANVDKEAEDITSLLGLLGIANGAATNQKVTKEIKLFERILKGIKQGTDAIDVVSNTADGVNDVIIHIERKAKVGKNEITIHIDTPVKTSDRSKYKEINHDHNNRK